MGMNAKEAPLGVIPSFFFVFLSKPDEKVSQTFSPDAWQKSPRSVLNTHHQYKPGR
jgi:hypothetical protein